MKILYTTDLHGRKDYYAYIKAKALTHKVDVVVNGGDMLPNTSFENMIDLQETFIVYLGEQYFPEFEKKKIHYVCCLGNDDVQTNDKDFDATCSRFKYIHNLAQKKVEINGFDFVGFNLVADYPFGLKDRCRMDTKDHVLPEQTAVTTVEAWGNVTDWPSFVKTLPTIEDELNNLPLPSDMGKAVYVMHMPPVGLGLDVLVNEKAVGSRAVRAFLEERKPLLSLHGHLHESYRVTSIWKAQLGNTICIQPGQGGLEPVHVLIDTDEMTFKRYGHPAELLMVNTYKLGGTETVFVNLHDFPDYIVNLFFEWMETHGKAVKIRGDNYVFQYEFDLFCRSQGMVVKYTPAARK